MRLAFKSLRFAQELERRRSEFSARKIAARITVPPGPENRWWYFQEFGTAMHNPDSPNPSGYEIHPVNGLALKLPDVGQGERMIPYIGFPFLRQTNPSIGHPGVEPKRFIANNQREIVDYARNTIGKTLLMSGFEFNALAEALMSDIMPRAKEIIVQGMSDALRGTRSDGKLNGQAAHTVFDTIAQIVEVS